VSEKRAVLSVDGINVFYGDFQALWDVSLKASEGQIISIIGTNGAGKSTLLKTIAGLMAPKQGIITFSGERISGLLPHETVDRKVALVPEGRRVFPRLSVHENLLMGCYTPRARAGRHQNLQRVYELFPILHERSHQSASTLSGGEQQMLAIGRALMSEPQLLLCDEISLGLAPKIIKDIYQTLTKINAEGITIVLVEQDITQSLKVSDQAYVLLEGKVVLKGEPAALGEESVRKAYFGI
jgi:branched-chain amino acid transport system ATP-binding protein